MIKEAIKKLVAGNDLTFDEAAQVMDEMFSGTATQSQMAAYLTALRIKGETIDEITASAQVMREKALHIKPNRDVLDIVGTGGDGKENAEITKEILSGEIKDAKRDIVVLNAALGLCTGGKADSIQDGIKLANEIIDSGKAYAKIEEFAKASNE